MDFDAIPSLHILLYLQVRVNLLTRFNSSMYYYFVIIEPILRVALDFISYAFTIGICNFGIRDSFQMNTRVRLL